jgi:hypothetical protein
MVWIWWLIILNMGLKIQTKFRPSLDGIRNADQVWSDAVQAWSEHWSGFAVDDVEFK